ncbi:unnamed protein product [Soboliphyme baturini]|uniref:Secreted protein n=1 Tax=Soboliphyme baturini TaxID=241478 RepID=A0A183IZH8_9BILA|nr:unnamed protein product [Soboliphyme baturini]
MIPTATIRYFSFQLKSASMSSSSNSGDRSCTVLASMLSRSNRLKVISRFPAALPAPTDRDSASFVYQTFRLAFTT